MSLTAVFQPVLYVCFLNRPGFPGECFICELRLPDHRFRWKHNKLFLLLP
ncbi:pyridine nucleotide-disulfide oxidoreductase, partial [Escherichia coli]